SDRPASYPVSVRRLVSLLHAAFRPHVAVTPWRFATLLLHQDGRGLASPSNRTCPAHIRVPPAGGRVAEGCSLKGSVRNVLPDPLFLVRGYPSAHSPIRTPRWTPQSRVPGIHRV